MIKNKFKYILVLILIAVMSVTCCACGGGKRSDSFNNLDDYANAQGYRNWYYCFGSVEEPEYMTFDTNIGWWKGRDSYSLIEIVAMCPGLRTETMMAFEAPYDCAASVKLVCKLTNPTTMQGPDGVFVYALYDDPYSDYLCSQKVDKEDVKEYVFEFDVDMKEGKRLWFVLNAGNNNAYDNMRFDITVDVIEK